MINDTHLPPYQTLMSQNQNLFTIKPLNPRTKIPAPRSLFGEFWLEGELAVLFSDAGKGKSLLAAQIARSIASAVPVKPLDLTAPAQKVLYFDLELSERQFAMRYSPDPEIGDELLKDSYRFPENFCRAEITPRGTFPEEYKTYEEYLFASIEEAIRDSGAKVVVIDSIAWLQGPNTAARHTVPLMRELKRIKSALGLSVLVLAHNPRRDNSRPLNISGLHGAGVMCNFADSVFALGQSRIDSGFRYLKHIKSRSTEVLYDEKNVLVGEIRKWETNFLAFNFYKFSPESEHLSKEINPLFEERVRQVREMYEDKEMTQRDIAADLGISLGSVNRCLQIAIDGEDCIDPDDEFDDDEDDTVSDEPPNSPNTVNSANSLQNPGRPNRGRRYGSGPGRSRDEKTIGAGTAAH
jgi:hypothetical protein